MKLKYDYDKFEVFYLDVKSLISFFFEDRCFGLLGRVICKIIKWYKDMGVVLVLRKCEKGIVLYIWGRY